MLTVDLLHEFELGVWKQLFVHLVRILGATDKALINKMDLRCVPLVSWWDWILMLGD